MPISHNTNPICDRRVSVACPSCGRIGLREFYDAGLLPVHNVLVMETYEEAISHPMGEVRLGLCEGCGFITNTRFDPSLLNYSSKCEDTQHFSAHFNRYADSLANRLVNDLGIREKTVVEIGSGGGDFLELICRVGENFGIGIDPASDPKRLAHSDSSRIRFLPEYYSERHSKLAADAILCRHSLEHIPKTKELLTTVRKSIGNRLETQVFFELPDTGRVLREAAFWDIYYEHCSYFTMGSLARLFRETDFDVTHLWTEYGDQYICLVATPAVAPTLPHLPDEFDLDSIHDDVERFQTELGKTVRLWHDRFNEFAASGKKVVIWGGSSKTVGFVNTLGLSDIIECVVDVNPRKWNRYLPGSGHQIVSPESLCQSQPDVVIVMNPVYLTEISNQLQELGLSPEIIAA
ncbi:class I SAM-dependent methyltransferase [Thalassoroseus pseudoceratinae]|uniref:class I SAM-dependent methyltransferase n=1 Tax=Thalassoroseus pseudoceratinae TaxID=2713176 RepID=UPI001421125C|nr:class I SAM-dependent methyltransferase [Thalassoroseus pseudoceratinae]